MIPLNYGRQGDNSRKRPFDHNEDASNLYSKRVVNTSFIRLCINAKSVGSVIGKAGCVMEELTKSFGVSVEIESDFEPYENIAERFVTISGTMDGIRESVRLILDTLPRKFDNLREGEESIQIVIANANAGKLIGKGGQQIRQVSEETGTNIRISNEYESPADKRNRTVIISGPSASLSAARSRVVSLTDGHDLEEYPGVVSVRIGVPHEAISLLIPRPGQPCAELSAFPSLTFRPAPDEDTASGFITRGLDVCGESSDVVAASRAIEEFVSRCIDEQRIEPTTVVLKVVFNSAIAGLVIGKGGENLRRMQEEFGVSVRTVLSSCYAVKDMERMFYFTGTASKIVDAVMHVLGQMAPNPLTRRQPVDLLQLRAMSTPMTSTSMAVTPIRPLPVMTTEGSTNAETSGQGVMNAMEASLAYMQQMMYPYGYMQSPYGYSYMPYGQCDMSTSTSQPSAINPAVTQSSASQPSVMNSMVQQPSVIQPSVMYSMIPQPPPQRSQLVVLNSWYTYVSGSAEEGTLVVAIPSDRCGNVLGRRGAVIDFVKASSACRISMQRREDMLTGATSRPVTVVGSPEGIVRAVRLMHLFMNISAKDIEVLIATPFSMNTDLQRYMASIPETLVLSREDPSPVVVEHEIAAPKALDVKTAKESEESTNAVEVLEPKDRN